VCQPALLTHGSSSKSGPEGIAVDATNVYWVEAQANNVFSCAKTGCSTPTVLATGQNGPFSIAVSGSNVYWSNWGHQAGDMGSLMHCAIDCENNPEVLAIGVGFRDIAVSTTGVYVASDALTGGVFMCGLTTCQPRPTAISFVSAPARGVALDATNVYYTADGQVVQCPQEAWSDHASGCGDHVVLATNVAKPWGIAVDSSTAYWIDYANGTVASCPVGGCDQNATTMYSTTAYEHPGTIAIDATTVYWAETDEGTVNACAKSGCNQNPTVLASSQLAPWGVAVDDACVYWTDADNGDVMKVAKL